MNEAKKPRILLVADYSNFHATLAKGLRKIGCDVTVASDGSTYMKCDRDLDLSRRFQGKAGGLLYAAKVWNAFRRRLSDFDIVSFRDPSFLDLRPPRTLWFFNRIADAIPNCFLSYITTDVPFLDMLGAEDSPLAYSEWFIDGKPNRLRTEDPEQWDGWHSPEMTRLNKEFYSRIKGAVTGLYEYHKAAERVLPDSRIAYGGLPIDLDSIPHKVISDPGKVRIFLARDCRRKLQKGSDFLETAARNVVSRHPDRAEFVMMENCSRKDYMEAMTSSHLMLDQMYSYTPATMALEGMAAGLTVISGGEKDFYDFIGEKENFPVVNSPVDLPSLEKTIEEVVLNPSEFRERSIRGREFVKKHNDMTVVARRFLDFWLKNSILQ